VFLRGILGLDHLEKRLQRRRRELGVNALAAQDGWPGEKQDRPGGGAGRAGVSFISRSRLARRFCSARFMMGSSTGIASRWSISAKSR